MKIIIQVACLLFVSTFTFAQSNPIPKDDIVARTTLASERFLPYPPLREADILWEKRVWRIIDTREKMNLPFRYPKMPLFTVLTEAVEAGQLQAYSVEDDQFSVPLKQEEVAAKLRTRDTILVIKPEIYSEEYQIVENEFDPQDVKRYRLKEIWYFDSRLGKLEVRILGIAPLREVYDDNGNFLYETPMFWLHFPECRRVLANHPVYNPRNDHHTMSWTDLFDMRKFPATLSKNQMRMTVGLKIIW
jgi:gliding motility associated protien GldN